MLTQCPLPCRIAWTQTQLRSKNFHWSALLAQRRRPSHCILSLAMTFEKSARFAPPSSADARHRSDQASSPHQTPAYGRPHPQQVSTLVLIGLLGAVVASAAGLSQFALSAAVAGFIGFVLGLSFSTPSLPTAETIRAEVESSADSSIREKAEFEELRQRIVQLEHKSEVMQKASRSSRPNDRITLTEDVSVQSEPGLDNECAVEAIPGERRRQDNPHYNVRMRERILFLWGEQGARTPILHTFTFTHILSNILPSLALFCPLSPKVSISCLFYSSVPYIFTISHIYIHTYTYRATVVRNFQGQVFSAAG